MKKVVPILVILLGLFFVPIKNSEANTTVIYVDPPISEAEIFHTFQINISLSQVTDLAAWEFKLYYRNNYLNATQIKEGSFLKTAGSTAFFIQNFTDNYNATHGLVWAYCTLIGQGSGATGSGTLATITFKAKHVGTTSLHLAETDLLDSKMPPKHINHTTADGLVTILGHDIEVSRVNPLKTIVGQNYSMNINVTIVNQGSFLETFNVTLYANTLAIETKEITIQNGASTTVTFTWNTTGFAKGNYTLWAYAWPVQGETNTEDNTKYFDGIVKVTIPGDVDGDFKVTMTDIILLVKAFGSKIGQPKYNPNCDINNDGIINMDDIMIALNRFGKIYRPYY